MKTVLIVMQSVVYNRGDEALSRGTAYIVKSHEPDARIILNSSELIFPQGVNVPYVDEYVQRYSYKSKASLRFLVSAFVSRVLKNKEKAVKIRHSKLLQAAKKADVIIVMAGDNFDVSPEFSFDGNSRLYQLLKKQNNAKLIMYDCSMGIENANPSVVRGFNKFDAVTARDSISLQNLIDAGVEKVDYFPDPAFAMQTETCRLPDGWKQGQMIGVNLSNLALRSKYGGDKEKVLRAYFHMINTILERTELSVVLIPHVMNNADLSVLRIIYEKYRENDRVLIIDNEKLSAAQLKYIISNCEAFVGARTHSTIAAYSSCVPTLVLGYSIKSIGIAKDLFGTHEHYVVPVYNISDKESLALEVMALIENRGKIRKNLEEIMPEYIAKAMEAGKLFI